MRAAASAGSSCNPQRWGKAGAHQRQIRLALYDCGILEPTLQPATATEGIFMSLQLYDTYTRSRRDFVARRPPHVGLYRCGPTVYNYAHLGHLVSDGDTSEDKMKTGAARTGKTVWEIA